MRTECALEYSHSRPVIEVLLNEVGLKALIDTGAEVPVFLLPKFVAARLRMKYRGGGYNLEGFSGSILCDCYEGNIKIGDIVFEKVPFLVNPMVKSFSLVLPASMFIDFDVTINNSSKTFVMCNDSESKSYSLKVRNEDGSSMVLENEGFLSGINDLTLNS